MAYHRYETKGIVLETLGQGEGDIYCKILTEDLGSISAAVKSARLPKSKLAPGVQLYSYSLFSLIRGKHSWKIVGVQNINQTYYEFKDDQDKLRLWVRFLTFLKRLIAGEQKHPELFAVTLDLYRTLLTEHFDKKELFAVECIAVLTILTELGHMPQHERYREILKSPFSAESIVVAIEYKPELTKDINDAIASSDL